MKTKKTKTQRRLIVLKDAVKQLQAKKLIGNQGHIFWGLKPELRYDKGVELQNKLKDFFKIDDKQLVCSVCARGALLISTIHKENSYEDALCNTDNGSFNEDNSVDKRLLKLFTKNQICLMENAFEASHDNYLPIHEKLDAEARGMSIRWGINHDKLTLPLARKSYIFGAKIQNNTDKLIAIFKNAIKNKGIFKP